MVRPLPPFEMIERAPGRHSVLGQVDVATSPHLRQLAGQHGSLVLDLNGVTLLDATGVAALVRLRDRCQHDECTFAIEAASEPVERVLQLVDLHEVLLGSVVSTTDPIP